MTTHHVAFTANVPATILATAKAASPRAARSLILARCWYERRDIEWQATTSLAQRHDQSPTRHQAQLALDCPEASQPRRGALTLTVKVAPRGGEEPLDKARRVLDLPGRIGPRPRIVPRPGSLDRGSFSVPRGDSVIGPMPADWPIDRILTDYSHNLGSYGQGGVGLSGWQCNGGSWIILPLKGSDGWIWLTRELIAPATDFRTLAIDIDQRIIGVHPNQLPDFPPWEHLYAGHERIENLPDFSIERATISRFEATPSGFVLEAANGLDRWRFAMGDHLPRPIWAGSLEPRDLHEGESVAGAFLLAHDCFLDV
ncbi:hypothetical protein AX777_17765 [Sphingobium yanoikuyae]|uniref:Uncharacterized protein n=1 Tax=Sphingobium yanoikuyae TaxID=13690 RepID=A0A177JX06_SPHYA|nr:hypothetical protein [Sphingobium yanoikuyae]OAH45454.1 hypothetical protein AX777_17765 [Sphingobium yanoikuyae]